jgi:hypothetical protein
MAERWTGGLPQICCGASMIAAGQSSCKPPSKRFHYQGVVFIAGLVPNPCWFPGPIRVTSMHRLLARPPCRLFGATGTLEPKVGIVAGRPEALDARVGAPRCKIEIGRAIILLRVGFDE